MSLFIPLTTFAVKSNQCAKHSTKNFTKLWPKKSIGNQCGVNSCHSFQIVGLMEATHSLLFDRNIDLSENDLFRQHYQGPNKGKNISTRMYDFTNAKLQDKETREFFKEVGFSDDDFKIVKGQGICFENTRPYSEFAFAGNSFKALKCVRANKLKLEKLIGQCKSDGLVDNNEIKQITRLCSTVKSSLIREGVDREFSKVPTNQCLKERAQVKKFANSLKNKTEYLSNKSTATKKDLILKYLQCQPIGVSVKGYSKILKDESHSSHDGGHALIIAGYNCQTNQFIMRNSWGGGYENVDADLLSAGSYRLNILSSAGNVPDANGVCPDVKRRESYIKTNKVKEKLKVVNGNTYKVLHSRPFIGDKQIGIYKNYYYKNGKPTYSFIDGKFKKYVPGEKKKNVKRRERK
ncbi:hypothetical protein A9Q84_10875 [Halobacteriovorax marinus]|uniref:Peptidase C1A papain C-terminal domain-containing protein n=1 Tax=Halobacteriovorax marinus TaxID=97084 RepID=A0A1Y5FE04_9BACT|nr:hypothetical protein A9Q84_10875 [Halobacteriovorax marinus]